MATLNAYITFGGNCQEAMQFYKDCFGGELKLETVKGSPMESHWPKEVQNHILHASLTSQSITLLASDMVEPNGLTVGNNITLALVCETDQEVEGYFAKLANDGSVKYPLHNFYNGRIGGIKDKFGINWLLKR